MPHAVSSSDWFVQHRLKMRHLNVLLAVERTRNIGRAARELEGVMVQLPTGLACVFGAPRSLEDHLERAILAALKGSQPMTASEIARLTGISAATVSPSFFDWSRNSFTGSRPNSESE